jgi:hypothetical protein
LVTACVEFHRDINAARQAGLVGKLGKRGVRGRLKQLRMRRDKAAPAAWSTDFKELK